MPKITPEESSPSSTAKNQAPPKRKRILWIAITVVVAIAGLIAWDAWDKSVRAELYRLDETLNNALTTAGKTDDPILVRDNVNFKWDEVALFEKMTEIEKITALTGETGLPGRYTSSDDYLFVFRHKGQIVKVNWVTANVRFEGEFGRLVGTDAMIVKGINAKGNPFLVLTD